MLLPSGILLFSRADFENKKVGMRTHRKNWIWEYSGRGGLDIENYCEIIGLYSLFVYLRAKKGLEEFSSEAGTV